MPTQVHAVVGCGRIAPNHVDAFRALPDVEVRWAVDRDPEVAERFAAEYDVPRHGTDLDEALADPELTSVSVTVDHAQHTAIADRALRAGRHVLVEKPFATRVDDAQATVALARERDRVLSVVSQHRYDPVVEAVADWVSAGLLGRITQAHAVLECFRGPEYYADYWHGTRDGEGGSALINQGYHPLDVLRVLCGGRLQVVGATAGTLVLGDAMDNEDTLAAVLRAPDGLAATYSVTVTSSVEWRSRIGLTGTEGSVVFDLDHPGELHHCAGSAKLLGRADELRNLVRVEPAPGTSYYGSSHRRQVAEFVAAVRTGAPVRADADEGLATLELIDALYTAAGAR
ncbi:MAG: Gfo/Idh/MocA family oxidoreductase [Actinocatenispora sp.]